MAQELGCLRSLRSNASRQLVVKRQQHRGDNCVAAAQPRPTTSQQLAETGGGSTRLAVCWRRRRRVRHPVAAAGASSHHNAFDPDTYEHGIEDPDDYAPTYSYGSQPASGSAREQQQQAMPAIAAAQLSQFLRGAATPAGGAAAAVAGEVLPRHGANYDGELEQAEAKPRRRQHPLGRGLRRLFLFFAGVHRLLSRLQTALFATGRVAWQLGLEALQSCRRSAAHAKQRAQEAFVRSPAGKKVEVWQKTLDGTQQELPEGLWARIMWLWDQPDVQKLRLTISMANFSIRLPALVALVATQIGLLSTSLSLPMLAPLLLGTGMLMRSIRTNASLVFPRIGLLVVLLWLLWFANSVIQNTATYLRKQGAIDQRVANNINSAAELTVLVTAGVILLSMLGVNVSALLLPAGVAAAVAAKDLSHNFFAGFFLMMVQPFRLGDRVGVTLPSGSTGGGYGGSGGAWFEGVCEKVDLRYTSLRQGKRRLMVPNSAFLQQPFMITEDAPVGGPPEAPPQPPPGAANQGYQPYITHDGRHVWHQAYSMQQTVNGAPLHQELAREAAPGVDAAGAAGAGAAAGAAGPPTGGVPGGGMPQQYDQQAMPQQQQQQYGQQAMAQDQQQQEQYGQQAMPQQQYQHPQPPYQYLYPPQSLPQQQQDAQSQPVQQPQQQHGQPPTSQQQPPAQQPHPPLQQQVFEYQQYGGMPPPPAGGMCYITGPAPPGSHPVPSGYLRSHPLPPQTFM